MLSKQSRVLGNAGYVGSLQGTAAVGQRPTHVVPGTTAESRQAVQGHLAWLAQLEEAVSAGTRDVRQARPLLVIATNRATYCRLCLAAADLVLTCTASRARKKTWVSRIGGAHYVARQVELGNTLDPVGVAGPGEQRVDHLRRPVIGAASVESLPAPR